MTGNRMKQQLLDLRTGLSDAISAAADRYNLPKLAEYAIRFGLGFLVSQARLFGGLSPLALGLLASAGPGGAGLATLAGLLPGYLLGGFGWALRYVAPALLIFSVLAILKDAPAASKPWFAPVVTVAVFTCTGFAYLYSDGLSVSGVLSFAAEISLAAAAARCSGVALGYWNKTGTDLRRAACLMLLAGFVLAGLCRVTLFGMLNIGRMLCGLCVLLTSCRGGLPAGLLSGVILGVCADAASGGGGTYTVLLSCGGLATGLASGRGRLRSDLTYILMGAACALWRSDSGFTLPILYETFAASVLFLLIPQTLPARLSTLFPGAPAGYGARKARDYTRERVELTADAFRTLYNTVRSAAGFENGEEDFSTVFDKASEAVCRKCGSNRYCWRQEYESTVEVMKGLTASMHSRGGVQPGDFPLSFAQHCEHLPMFADALNEEWKALRRRRLYRSRLRERQDAAWRQYADMASILREIAAELGDGIVFDPIMERRLEQYLRSQDADASSAVFRDRAGRLHIELMGTTLFRIRRDLHYLDKLSAVAGCRLCAAAERCTSTRMILLEAEPLAVSVGIASFRKEGQTVSGDRGTWFKTDEGCLYVILSDGMGSGESAAASSTGTVKTLESFLRAGVAPETALRLLSDLMLLQNECTTTCATVDLLCINLFTGDARVYKYGAAPTYVLKNGAVRRLKSRNPAAGLVNLGDATLSPVKLRLEADTAAVILSDGILCGDDDAWLRELLAAKETSGSRELAKAVLENASARFGCPDDMTVLTVCPQRRK